MSEGAHFGVGEMELVETGTEEEEWSFVHCRFLRVYILRTFVGAIGVALPPAGTMFFNPVLENGY